MFVNATDVHVLTLDAVQVAGVVSTPVALTVSVSTCDASLAHTRVAVTLLLSLAQAYSGVPYAWPVAAIISVSVCAENNALANVAVNVLTPVPSHVAGVVISDVALTVSVTV